MHRIASVTAVATAGTGAVAAAPIEHGARIVDLMATVYVVVVRHNIVTALEQVPDGTDAPVAKTTLEIGTQLAENYRVSGCIDGRYLFDNAQRARVFAVLCLEFVHALVNKRLEAVKALAAGAEYHAPEHAGGGRAP